MSNQDTTASNSSPFEAIRHTTDAGTEYWTARELADVLGYATSYRNFQPVIKKAITACEGSGYAVSDHFAQVRTMIETGKGAKRQAEDYHLSRYACYLVVQNADPDKPIVALGQTYFAVQTRRAELADAQLETRRRYRRLGYSEEWIDRRLQGIVVRDELTAEWQQRGAKEGKEFGILTEELQRRSMGVSTSEHKQVKNLPARANLRDSETGLELALTALTDETAKVLHRVHDSQGFEELHDDTKEAGDVGGAARRDIEARTGEPVVSSENYKTLRQERQKHLQSSLFPSDTDDTDDTDDAAGEDKP